MEPKEAAAMVSDANTQSVQVEKVSRKDLLSTGSTLLNLACSGNPYGGFLRGKFYLLVGDSASGKTFLAITCLAEAVLNPRFKDYRLVYDNIEDGCLLDIDGLFSEQVADRIEPPELDDAGQPVYSSTVEEFYYHVDDIAAQGKPFVYVLDSMDALASEASEDKFQEHKDAHRKGKEAVGSYGDGKARINSERLRIVVNRLRESGSILIVLSQTRDNLGFGFEKRTRSGGRALRFYATAEVWSSVAKSLKKTVKGKEREVGVRCKLEVKKNRITGRRGEVCVDIFPSHGLDDLGSCVDYLVEEGWWATTKNTIVAEELGITASREKLLRQIEDEGRVAELRSVVGRCWAEIQAACDLKRRNRYASPMGTD